MGNLGHDPRTHGSRMPDFWNSRPMPSRPEECRAEEPRLIAPRANVGEVGSRQKLQEDTLLPSYTNHCSQIKTWRSEGVFTPIAGYEGQIGPLQTTDSGSPGTPRSYRLTRVMMMQLPTARMVSAGLNFGRS